MKIGLISDTHNHWPKGIEDLFGDRDLILHAGDIGSYTILRKLEDLAPTRAVYGNVDLYSVASELSSRLLLDLEGIPLLLIHNIGKIHDFISRLKRGEFNLMPRVVVFGHTHEPIFQKYGEIYFVNPGSAGVPGKNRRQTVMHLEISGEQIIGHQLLELNK